MLLKQKYQCPTCEDVYDSEYMAERCCPIRVVYICGGCKKTFGDYDKEDAEACCMDKRGSVNVNTQCFICNDGPLTVEDVQDSRIVGSALRCRSHILAVAPELLTAESIATRREA